MTPDSTGASPGDASSTTRGRSCRPLPAGVSMFTATTITSLALFGPTLRDHFVGEDFAYVGRFFSYTFADWPRLFVREWSEGLLGFSVRELRPMMALTFMVDSRIWAGQPFGYRVTNLLAHVLCGTLVGLLAWYASQHDISCGVLASVLFALHPAHAEAVLWITGRVDPVPTVFYLAGFIAFLRYRARDGAWWLLGLWVAYAFAVFAKEFALTLPLMALVADVVWHRRSRNWRAASTWTPYLGWLVIAVVYLACRRAAFGSQSGPGLAWVAWGSRLFYAGVAQRQLIYLGELVPPLQAWLHEGAPLLRRPAAPMLALIVAGAICAVVVWKRWPERRGPGQLRATAFFAIGWYLVATVPLIVTYISPRHLYLASAGVCVAWALLLRGLVRRRLAFGIVAVALAAVHAHQLVSNIRPWHEAAAMSRDIAAAVADVARSATPGAALILDVPDVLGQAYVWSHAVPFAVRPPFLDEALDARLLIIESPDVYEGGDVHKLVRPWSEHPALMKLPRVEANSWLIDVSDTRRVRRFAVPAAKLRAAADHLVAHPRTPSIHEAWRRFVSELGVP